LNLGSCYSVRVVSVTAASEQHKLSKNEVVEKVIPVADFWMSADDVCQKL